MKKVLFESSIFLHQKVGGVSKYITKLNQNLFKHKISSKILSPITINDYLDNKKENVIYYLKFKKIPKFCRKIFFFINNFSTFIYIKFKKPDLLHFSYYNKSLIKFLDIPYILTVYDLIHEKIKSNQNEFEKEKLLNRAKHIIRISKETQKDLIKIYKINKEKISVIYLGVENKKFKISKKKYRYILFVGNRTRYKNFDNLVKAFSGSKYLVKNFKIICFGGGKFLKHEIQNFENLSIKDNLNHVDGNDEKLFKFYKNASLYITLSNYEGFGLTLLEAMKMKCPVLCSDIPVFREIYKNSCKFVNPKNINNIRKGMENILKSNIVRKRLIFNSIPVIKRFSWEECALNTSKIYKKILN